MKMSLSKMDREVRPEPFELTLSDDKTVVTFADPKRMQFTKVVALDEMNTLDQIRTLVGEDGYKALAADENFDAEALEWAMTGWRDHYGLGEQGEAPGSRG